MSFTLGKGSDRSKLSRFRRYDENGGGLWQNALTIDRWAGKPCFGCDQEFFPEGHVRSNFLCNLGYGDFANAFAIVGLMVGTLGVTGLVIGCMLMVRETRLAVRYLTEEAKLALR